MHGLAFEVLHRDEATTVVVRDLVDLNDRWMREPRAQASFRHEHREMIRVLGQGRPELFDDDQLVEPRWSARHGQVNVRHAPPSEHSQNLVLTGDDFDHRAYTPRSKLVLRAQATESAFREWDKHFTFL